MNKVKLSEIANIKMGQSPSGETCNEVGEGVALLNGPAEFTSSYPVPKQYTIDGKRFCNKGDILFCVRGSTTGRMNWADQKYALGRGLASISHKNGYEYNHFLKFLLYSNLNALLNAANGSTFPNLTSDILASFEMCVPDLKIQRSISIFLNSIDSKIELNNQINAELESMAKTLYDYWFVQYDFPNENEKPYKSSGGKMVWSEELKREIPEEWELHKLGDLGNFKNGVNYDPSNPGDVACPIINVRNISSSTYFLKNEDLDIVYLRMSDVKKYAVHNGSIIIARSGIPGATRLIADIAENTLYCGFAIHYELENLDYKIPVFFYLKSIEYQIQNGSGGTIMKNVNQLTLNALNVSLPRDKGLILAFNNLIKPIFDKISLIQNENQKLTELRDWLLPMLMNGQVKV